VAAALLLLVFASGAAAGGEDDERGAIKNPYYERAEWKVWRDDETPVEGVTSMVRKDKKDVAATVTLAPVPRAERTYPVDPPSKGPYIAFEKRAKPSAKYAGMWDDVYASWSGLHGYVRTRWRGADGSNVTVRGQIIDFVDARKNALMAAGVNFIHQSTTSMGHAITNGRMADRTLGFEKLYFGDVLVTAPAHASLTDHGADRSTDLYTAHVSTLFNSVGSSNSETMAITKMAIVGAYLPPATKLLLKRNGLYPAALLYIWKAALPYDVPYGHELRHRIAYKAVGDRAVYSKLEKYGAAGIDRGDMSLPFHCYDDEAHMHAMVDIARSMDVALPEALFSVIRAEGEAPGGYRLRKAAMIVQEKGRDVTLTVSTEGCYDLQDLPLTVRWKLLYGTKETTVEPSAEDPHEWTIEVPWNDALPEGRTAIALIASNGRFDSNPAIITVYRKRSEDMPPAGLSGGVDYRWPNALGNRRPVLLGLQDRYVKRGQQLEVALEAVDPEGLPVAFHKRGGDVGTIDGSLFSWRCPRKEPKGAKTVTLIASDETGGSSYGGEAFEIHVDKPAVLAQIDVDRLVGKAPLTVHVSSKPSLGRKLKSGWEFHPWSLKHKPKPFKDLVHGRKASHTFEKPGIHEITLTVEAAGGTDTETIRVLALADDAPARPAALRVEGAGVLVRPDDETPSAFDGTDFGVSEAGAAVTRTFRIANTGDEPLKLDGRKAVVLEGPGAGAFRVVRQPRPTVAARGSTSFDVRFEAREGGTHAAHVVVRAGSLGCRFAIRGAAP
jgi:hypothetical protein